MGHSFLPAAHVGRPERRPAEARHPRVGLVPLFQPHNLTVRRSARVRASPHRISISSVSLGIAAFAIGPAWDSADEALGASSSRLGIVTLQKISMSQPAASVEFHEVTLRLPDGRALLDRVSLKLDAGATTAILGRSGSGKTTLLRTVNRMIEPTSGEVRVDGRA